MIDEEWQRLELLLNGVFFRTRSGTAWCDLPPVYGNGKTVYDRHRCWSLDGTWEYLLDWLRSGGDEAEGADWMVSVDSTVTRAHQHAAGARRVLAADARTGGGVE